MNIDQSLRGRGYTVSMVYETVSGLQREFKGFPASYDEILSYGIIMLNNGDTSIFTTLEREMFTDYVKAGGKVIVLGGSATVERSWSRGVTKTMVPFKPASDIHPGRPSLAVAGNSRIAEFMPEQAYQVLWQADGEPELVVRQVVDRGATPRVHRNPPP